MRRGGGVEGKKKKEFRYISFRASWLHNGRNIKMSMRNTRQTDEVTTSI